VDADFYSTLVSDLQKWFLQTSTIDHRPSAMPCSRGVYPGKVVVASSIGLPPRTWDLCGRDDNDDASSKGG
jgi:hypothetical protein